MGGKDAGRFSKGWKTAVLLAVLAGSAQGATLYVWTNSPFPGAPYNDWTNAAREIQAAIDAAGDGDTILVTNGLYRLTNQLEVGIGIEVRSVNGPESARVDGDDTWRGVWLYHTSAVFSGFSITNCQASVGAGARIDAGLLTNCVVFGNWARDEAGGIYCGAEGRIQDCRVEGNGAVNLGGGIVCTGGVIFNSRIVDNRAMYGGGLACVSTGRMRNCEIIGNRASYGGGGLCVVSNSRVLVENCTISGNFSEEGHGGLRCMETGSVFVNTIIHGNSAKRHPNLATGGQVFAYCCLSPLDAGEGNTSNDPSFLALDLFDCRLATGSPCVNAGTNLSWMADAVDIGGNSRILGDRADIGANEAGPFACAFSADRRGGVVSVPVWFLARVSGADVSNAYFRWDYDNNGTPDAWGYGLASVTNSYAVDGGYSVALSVSNAAGETAHCVRTNLVAALPAASLYVATNGSGVFPYSSWPTASRDLRAAADAAPDGCVIWVSNGVYVVAREAVLARTTTVKSVNGPAGAVVEATGRDRCFALRTPAAVLDGLTISNGSAVDGGGVHLTRGGLVTNCVVAGNAAATNGGGVFLSMGGQVRNSVVRENTAGWLGGGIVCVGDGAVLDCLVCGNEAARDGGGVNLNYGGLARGTVFSNNQAAIGGGVFCYQEGLVTNCLLTENLALEWAGGFGSYSGAVLVTSTVLQNRSYGYGGGAAIWGATGLADRVVFIGNSASNGGGGMYCEDSILRDSTFRGNVSRDGGGLYIMAGSRAANNILTGNRAERDGGAFRGGASSNDTEAWTLTGCAVFSNYAGSGGGGGYAWSGEVRTCTFAANTSYWGGGVYAAAATIGDSSFSNNIAVEGGGGYVVNGAVVTNCRLVGNHATHDGGGLNISTIAGDPRTGKAIDCAVESNSAASGGGGAFIYEGVLEGCSMGANTSALGGGVYAWTATVRDGVFVGNQADTYGGGVFARGGSSVSHCEFTGNLAWNLAGGGVYNEDSSVTDCRFLQNMAPAGGGAVGAQDFLFEHGWFLRNQAHWGGGLFLNSADPSVGTVRCCYVGGNVVDNSGGGIYVMTGAVENCVVVTNYAPYGGGVYLNHDSRLLSSTVSSNIASGQGGGVFCRGDGAVWSSIVYFNLAAQGDNIYTDASTYVFHNSCTWPLANGSGNTTNDPLFVSRAGGDYRLLSNSPCIDTGSATAAPPGDHAGVARPLDGNDDGVAAPDMGAHEYVHPTADTDGDGLSDSNETAVVGTNPVTNNTDGDAAGDFEEHVSGSDPKTWTAEGDLFRLRSIVRAPSAGGAVIQWPAVTGRLYTVSGAGDVLGPWTNTAYADVPGVNGTMSCTNADPAASRHLRVNVRLAP